MEGGSVTGPSFPSSRFSTAVLQNSSFHAKVKQLTRPILPIIIFFNNKPLEFQDFFRTCIYCRKNQTDSWIFWRYVAIFQVLIRNQLISPKLCDSDLGVDGQSEFEQQTCSALVFKNHVCHVYPCFRFFFNLIPH